MRCLNNGASFLNSNAEDLQRVRCISLMQGRNDAATLAMQAWSEPSKTAFLLPISIVDHCNDRFYRVF
jgi:hypothetical protein